MTQETQRLYPVGIQTFSEIRNKNYMYIDKTAYVYHLTHVDPKYIFLSRPRRFGKSLLTSTLQSYFEGKKELFEGLKIMELEKEWTVYPVLHFDLSRAKHMDRKLLEEYLTDMMNDTACLLDIPMRGETPNLQLKNLIMDAYRKYNRQVVVLFDEYDAPLLDVVHEEENLPQLRQVMRNFYSPIKAADPYLRFVFFTGITKFSQLSVFSELNNITNVSMDEPYAAICGITKEEIVRDMRPDIEAMAERYGISYEAMLQKLKEYYDGYHFCWPSPDIFNPFSLITAMSKKKLGAYWFESGTPTYIIELLRKYHTLPSEIGNEESNSNEFNVPIEQASNYKALLYQAGYLTIKNADIEYDAYTLDIPNKEVRIGLMNSLIPSYVVPNRGDVYSVLLCMARAVDKGDIQTALVSLQTFLGTVPQCDNTNYEGHYQQMLYVIFSLLGMYADVEVRTPRGRVDMVLRSKTNVFIVELKLNQSAESAMNQIDLKQYPERFALYPLPKVKVAINFSSEEKNITDWKIEEI